MIRELAVLLSVYKNDKLKYVKESIESILKQKYSEFDLYIYIDGEIESDVKLYIDNLKDTRLFVKNAKQNYGLAICMNKLLDIVIDTKDYNYIARMDADDISLDNRFLSQINFLKKNINVDCVGTWAIEIDENGNELFNKRMPIQHSECVSFFSKRDCFIHPTVMFRRSFFEKVPRYPVDTYFAEDTMMWALGIKSGCVFANVPEYLLKFRVDSSFYKRRRGWKHFISIIKLRFFVTKYLNYGFKGYFFSVIYATTKLLPSSILNLVYKNFR